MKNWTWTEIKELQLQLKPGDILNIENFGKVEIKEIRMTTVWGYSQAHSKVIFLPLNRLYLTGEFNEYEGVRTYEAGELPLYVKYQNNIRSRRTPEARPSPGV